MSGLVVLAHGTSRETADVTKRMAFLGPTAIELRSKLSPRPKNRVGDQADVEDFGGSLR